MIWPKSIDKCEETNLAGEQESSTILIFASKINNESWENRQYDCMLQPHGHGQFMTSRLGMWKLTKCAFHNN